MLKLNLSTSLESKQHSLRSVPASQMVSLMRLCWDANPAVADLGTPAAAYARFPSEPLQSES